MKLSNRQSHYGDDALLTEVQASDLLFLSVRTLQTWRSERFGPAYIRVGRAIRYRLGDLLAWIEANKISPVPTRPRDQAPGDEELPES